LTARAPPATHPLSLHDALPISLGLAIVSAAACARTTTSSAGSIGPTPMGSTMSVAAPSPDPRVGLRAGQFDEAEAAWNIRLLSTDRKSTRLNSSHLVISYAVFC